MSLYPAYLKEREGLDILENEHGFVTYKNRGHDFYIQDVYVLPEYRKAGIASKLANTIIELAKLSGCKILTGSVDSRANGADTSDKVLRAYGMRPYTKEGFVTYYLKELV